MPKKKLIFALTKFYIFETDRWTGFASIEVLKHAIEGDTFKFGAAFWKVKNIKGKLVAFAYKASDLGAGCKLKGR